jgi:hypothetical protein
VGDWFLLDFSCPTPAINSRVKPDFIIALLLLEPTNEENDSVVAPSHV